MPYNWRLSGRTPGSLLAAIGLGAAYYTAIVVSYYYLISPDYAYMGLRFRMLPAWTWAISGVMAVLPLLWLPMRLCRPSDIASWILYLCLIFPGNIVIYMVSKRPLQETVVLTVSLTSAFLLFEWVRQKGLFKIPRIESPLFLFDIILPLTIIILSLFVLSFTGFNIDLSFTDVYARRMHAREILSKSGAFVYLLAFLGSVCMPIAVTYAIEKKRWCYFILVVLVVVSIFSLNGSKSIVFIPIVIVLMAIGIPRAGKTLGFWLIGGMTLFILLAIGETKVCGASNLNILVFRREICIPSMLTTYYWEFFSDNPHVFMKDSIFGWLVPAQVHYDIPRARLIGLEYFGDIKNNANANIWATAFADFGYVGMMVTSVLAALVLKVIDSMGRQKFFFASVCSTALGVVWLNTALYTSMLTNGGLGLIITLWLYPGYLSNPKPSYL